MLGIRTRCTIKWQWQKHGCFLFISLRRVTWPPKLDFVGAKIIQGLPSAKIDFNSSEQRGIKCSTPSMSAVMPHAWRATALHSEAGLCQWGTLSADGNDTTDIMTAGGAEQRPLVL